jgi:hypothetical protein
MARYLVLRKLRGPHVDRTDTQSHAADPIIGALHGSAVAIASARFIPEILSTANAIDVRL